MAEWLFYRPMSPASDLSRDNILPCDLPDDRQMTEALMIEADALLPEYDFTKLGSPQLADLHNIDGFAMTEVQLVVAAKAPANDNSEAFLLCRSSLTHIRGKKEDTFSMTMYGPIVPSSAGNAVAIGPNLSVQLEHVKTAKAGTRAWADIYWDANGQERVLINATYARDKNDVLAAWEAAEAVFRYLGKAGRSALLSVEDKRTVLAAIVKQAEKDGIPRKRLTLKDAADYLDEWCQKPQPVRIAGRRIHLPSPLSDRALDNSVNTQRCIERLRQWMEDVFGHRRWDEVKEKLLD